MLFGVVFMEKNARGEGGGRGDGGTDRGEESGGAGLSFHPRAAVFVRKRSFAFVGGRSRWRAVVFVRGRGGVVFPGRSWSCPGRSSFVRWGSSSVLSFALAVAVLGAGLSFADARRRLGSWGHHYQLRASN